MCRYALVNYKDHYACFDCRKSFKHQRAYRLYKADRLQERAVLCPQCGKEMHGMGLDFKAPKQTDIKQWKKVEILFEHGFTFHSCGCCGPGLRPAELNQVEEFLANNLSKSEGEVLLQKIAEQTKFKTTKINGFTG